MDCEYFTFLSLPNFYLRTVSSDMCDKYRDKYLGIFVLPIVQGDFRGVFLYVLRRRIKAVSVSVKQCVQSPGAYVEIRS